MQEVNRYSINTNGSLPNDHTILEELNARHPSRTNLSLEWSHRGRLVVIPLHPAYICQMLTNGRVARVEWYRDENGICREAFAYGKETKD